MKSERINQNQIRFTLNSADLKARHLKMSDLSYGSDKTKVLFDDMLRQAVTEYGFNAQAQPVMIEAIPVSEDVLIVTVTQVFNQDEIMTLFRSNVPDVMQGSREYAPHETLEPAEEEPDTPEEVTLIYTFASFEDVLAAAHTATPALRMRNVLYLDPETSVYYLIVSFIRQSKALRYVLTGMTEFASESSKDLFRAAYIQEHFVPVITARALQKLSEL